MIESYKGRVADFMLKVIIFAIITLLDESRACKMHGSNVRYSELAEKGKLEVSRPQNPEFGRAKNRQRPFTQV
jgi:hypothetical protein